MKLILWIWTFKSGLLRKAHWEYATHFVIYVGTYIKKILSVQKSQLKNALMNFSDELQKNVWKSHKSPLCLEETRMQVDRAVSYKLEYERSNPDKDQIIIKNLGRGWHLTEMLSSWQFL